MKTAVVVPNYNGESFLRECLEGLKAQTYPHTMIIVDNGSVDTSKEIIKSYENAVLIALDKNYGYTGGVIPGINYAIEHDFEAVALLNNDAVAESTWLENLVSGLSGSTGIVTSLILESDHKTIDTAGISMSSWGLPFPRHFKESTEISLKPEFVFGASGGASLYSIEMLKQIGTFDDDYFAYYEDVDLSLRAQFAGWKILFQPASRVYHKTSSTSKRWPGFRTYQMFKNLRILIVKNTPPEWKAIMYPRFYFAYSLFQIKALFSKDAWYMIKGSVMGIILSPKKRRERKHIMAEKRTDKNYTLSLLTYDLPPHQPGLRKIRSLWWSIGGKK